MRISQNCDGVLADSDQVPLNRVRGRRVNFNSVLTVISDDIAGIGGRPAHHVIRGGISKVNTGVPVAQSNEPGDICSEEVSLNCVVIRTTSLNLNPRRTIARNNIAGS